MGELVGTSRTVFHLLEISIRLIYSDGDLKSVICKEVTLHGGNVFVL